MVSRSWTRTVWLTLVYACAVLAVDLRPVAADTPDQKPDPAHPAPTEADEEYAAMGPERHGYVVLPTGERDSDLTGLIASLVERARQ